MGAPGTISSSFVWFDGHLSCSFTCWVFLSLHPVYIAEFWGGLSIFWQFVEFSLLWSFLAVGGVVSVACQGFWLGNLVLVFWWMELDFFSLECNEVSSNEL